MSKPVILSPAMRVPKNPLVKYPPCPACGKPIALDDSSDPPDYHCHICQVSFYFEQDGTVGLSLTGTAGPKEFEENFKKEFPYFNETFVWGLPK